MIGGAFLLWKASAGGDSVAGLVGLAGELPEPELPLVLEVDDGVPAADDTQLRSSSNGDQAAVHAANVPCKLVHNYHHDSAARARPSSLVPSAATVTDLTPLQA